MQKDPQLENLSQTHSPLPQNAPLKQSPPGPSPLATRNTGHNNNNHGSTQNALSSEVTTAPPEPAVLETGPEISHLVPAESSHPSATELPTRSPELMDSTLFLLQETLWNTLVQMRNRESVYDCYTAAKSRYQTQYTCLLHIDNIFKVLMGYPAEVLSAMYIPVILRFFKWCFSSEHIPRDALRSRFIITTKKGIAFLKANWSEYCYNTATIYQAFKALKLLQDLEMIFFPQKPAIANQNDEEAENPNWTPLDDSQLEGLIASVNKGTTSNMTTSLPFMSTEYLNQANVGVSDYMPLDHSNQSPSIPVMPKQQASHQFYGVHQSPLPSNFTEFQEPFVMPPQISHNDVDQQQRLEHLFSHTLPVISQKLNALGAANDDLRRQNNVLSESLRSLKYQFIFLKNSVEKVFPKTPSPASPRLGSAQFQEGISSNMVLSQPDPMDTTNVEIAPSSKLDLDLSHHPATTYDAELPYNSSAAAFRFGNELKPNEPMTADDGATIFSGEGRSITSPVPPVAVMMASGTSGSPNTGGGNRLAINKPRNKFREFMGTTLTKGEKYQPPITAEGKHYFVDEGGKLAIVMTSDQDSIYGMYNEYYQSLRPQIDSFVNDFGKRNLVHFRKKRTFQKKKAFVQWVERISYAKGMSPESVLDLINDVRQKENRSVVWSCNNLSSMKEAFVKHRPDFREIAMSDTE
ncbi:LAME_0G08922g1_1 [Lachancea meyersii CBS 8951]|uniref:LAME_0G08922g1_1 n=1 Tax=Lachancea meyersii CBS 8951 TaxID=1266667 RepID=A0A1G4K8E6_9SACH|nr:LAME_0G08922g1_1 [Lachancea meyersii CBS 8951]